MKKIINILKNFISIVILSFFISIIISENIIHANKRQCYDNVADLPTNKVGLLLGTSKYIGKQLNYYYKYRIEATSKLYKAGKIKYVLVSGDNHHKSYNEPETFKNDLIKNGIPENRIFLDYAGFRTFDSVIRSKKVFGQNTITVISQKFHNERALFIAKHNDIKAVAYNAKDLHGKFGLKTRIRERFARVKAILDVFVLNTKPKFLGEEIEIK